MYEDEAVYQDAPTGHEVLASELTVALATNVVFKFLAQGAHWNVKGKDFNEFHEFFGEIYEDAEGATDTYAELIRQLGYDAPFMLTDLAAVSLVAPGPCMPDCVSLTREIQAANNVIISALKKTFKCADECDEQGIADFIAERINAHMKLAWKLDATLHNTDY